MNSKKLFITANLFLAIAVNAASSWNPPVYTNETVAPELVAAIESALPKGPAVRPRSERKVLIFSATAGYRHGSIRTGKVALELMGKATGAYKTVISDDPANFELNILRTFDAVILLSPSLDFFMPSSKRRDRYSDEDWTWLLERHKRLTDNLIQYVENGGGLVGIHAATDSCHGHEAYGETIGGYFDGHPWRSKTNVTINVEDPEHAIIKPVFEGMKDFKLVEEIYQFKETPYSRDHLRILLNVDVEESDKVKGLKRQDNDYAVAWVQAVGRGRVFYTSIGHNDHIYSNPLMLKHYLAGIQFATGDLVGDTTPSNSKRR